MSKKNRYHPYKPKSNHIDIKVLRGVANEFKRKFDIICKDAIATLKEKADIVIERDDLPDNIYSIFDEFICISDSCDNIQDSFRYINDFGFQTLRSSDFDVPFKDPNVSPILVHDDDGADLKDIVSVSSSDEDL